MSTSSVEIVGLGELLWDLLPQGKLLGGAPGNFIFHCHQLGHSAALVSRVGADDLGREIRQTVRSLGLRDDWIQDDPVHPTGTVSVDLGPDGQPSFTIHENVAWDNLDFDNRLEALLGQARVVCFGTLVQRAPVSRATVQHLLRSAGRALVVCDINLRQRYYTREVIEQSLHASRWVKLNDSELLVLRDLLGLSGTSESERVADLRRRYHIELVALTRGEKGCLVQTAEQEAEVPGVRVQVVDTIGAGDAFTAGLVVSVLEGHSIGDAARFATRLAARVAAAAGGTPRIDRRDIELAS